MLSKHDIDSYIQQSKCGSDLHIFVTKVTIREIVEKQYSCIANSRSLQIVEVDFYDNSESVRLKSETDIIQDCIRV